MLNFNYNQYAYAGYIHMEVGKKYKFRANYDDSKMVKVRCPVTGEETVLFDQPNHGTEGINKVAFEPKVTGPHYIEMRFADGVGSRGGTYSGNNYFNSNNFGISDDDGATWSYGCDGGEGLLFSTGEATARIKEIVEGGTVKSFTLSVDSPKTNDWQVYLVCGDELGSRNPASWLHGSDVATAVLTAGETELTVALPEGVAFGDSGYRVAAVYLEDLRDDEVKNRSWTAPLYAADYSETALSALHTSVTDENVIEVSGEIVTLGGESTTLKLVISDEEGNVANDSVAAEFESTETFEFSLSADSLERDTLYYVVVTATTGDKTEYFPVGTVRTKGALRLYDNFKTSGTGRAITISAQIKDYGIGEASAEFWLGESEDGLVKVADYALTRDDVGIVFDYTLPAFNKTFYYQIRTANSLDGGTVIDGDASPIYSYATVDTSEYYWTGNGDDDLWTNPANWRTVPADVDSLGYPNSKGATVNFEHDCRCDIKLTEDVVVSYINTYRDSDGRSTSKVRIYCDEDKRPRINAIGLASNNNSLRGFLIFDNVEVILSANSSYLFNIKGETKEGDEYEQTLGIILTNSAHLKMPAQLHVAHGAELKVYAGSYLECLDIHLAKVDMVIDDSLVETSIFKLGMTTDNPALTGASTLTIKGENGALHCTRLRNEYPDTSSKIYFDIPEQGFNSAPIYQDPKMISQNATHKALLGKGNNNIDPGLLEIEVVFPCAYIGRSGKVKHQKLVDSYGGIATDKFAFANLQNGTLHGKNKDWYYYIDNTGVETRSDKISADLTDTERENIRELWFRGKGRGVTILRLE